MSGKIPSMKARVMGLWLLTILALALLSLVVVAFCVDAFRPDVIYVPAKMVMGEGGWSHCIGNAEMIVNGKSISYEVRVGNVVYASLSPVNGLMLISKEPLADHELGLLNHLVVYRDELCAASRIRVLKLPFIPDPTFCYGAVSLRPRWKADIFEKWEMRDVDGIREYDCALTRRCGKGGRVLLRIPEEFFHALGDDR